MLKTIKTLARAGVSVIPVRKNDKAPTQSNWSELKTLTPEQVSEQAPKWHNYGIRPGAHSKLANGDYLITIDLDIKDASAEKEALAKLYELIPEIDEFAVVYSGNKLGLSRHYVGSTNKPLRSRRLWAHPEKVTWTDGKKKDKAQIDIIGTGKQHVGPGSTHPDGYEYELADAEDFDSMIDDWTNGTRSHYISSSAFDIDDREDGPRPRKKIESLDDIVDHGPVEMSDDEIIDILGNLPVERIDDYQQWLEIGMALDHQFPDDPDYALELWHWVSKKSDKYDADELDDKWETIKDDKGTASITFRTLIKEANDVRRDKAAEEALDGVEDEEADEEQRKKDKKASWRKDLQVDDGGAIKNSLFNILLILRNDPRIRGCIRRNEFKSRIVLAKDTGELTKMLPRLLCDNKVDGTPWIDYHDATIRAWLESPRKHGGWGLKVNDRDLMPAILMESERNAFHPVRDYLNAQVWDGVKRIDRVWIKYFGAKDDEYNRESSKLFMTGAVARIMEPGTKFDFVPIFEGAQGKRKTSFIETLCVHRDWTGSLTQNLNDQKMAVESMAGKWILEMPELAQFRKSEIETVKHFISAAKDTTRLSYDRRSQDFQRQCVFMGTTNNGQYLSDETGNRRFWPVHTHTVEIDIEELRAEVGQLWAEATEAYKKMRADNPDAVYLPLYLRSKKSQEIAEQLQLSRMEDKGSAVLAEFLEERLNKPVGRDGDDFENLETPEYWDNITARTIWCDILQKDPAQYNQQHANQLGQAMRSLKNWTYITFREGSRCRKVWRRTDELAAPVHNVGRPKKRRDLLG